MEEKKRLSVRIAGRFLTVVTDEDPANLRQIEKQLNDRVDEMGRASPRMNTREGKIDAVVLCAIDALNRERTADERIEEAERRATDAEARYRRLLSEYNRLSQGGGGKRDPVRPGPGTEPDREHGAEKTPEEHRETIRKIRAILETIRDRGGTTV